MEYFFFNLLDIEIKRACQDILISLYSPEKNPQDPSMRIITRLRRNNLKEKKKKKYSLIKFEKKKIDKK